MKTRSYRISKIRIGDDSNERCVILMNKKVRNELGVRVFDVVAVTTEDGRYEAAIVMKQFKRLMKHDIIPSERLTDNLLLNNNQLVAITPLGSPKRKLPINN